MLFIEWKIMKKNQQTTKQLTLLIDPVHFSRRSVHRSIIVKKLFHWFFAITLSKHIRQSHIICYFFIILKLTKSCLLWVAYRIVDECMMMMNFRIFFSFKISNFILHWKNQINGRCFCSLISPYHFSCY